MRVYQAGTIRLPMPLYDGAGEGGGQPAGEAGGNADAGAFVFDAGKAYEGLEADNLEWLQKNEALMKDPKALVKHAFNQEKLLGNAIRVPKDDAPQEERDAFLEKLGRPKTDAEYKFEAPKNMPEGLPYDESLEKQFRGVAHKLGLTQQQAAGLRDMFVEYQTAAFSQAAGQSTEQLEARATQATETLVKKWGPLDGDTAKANFEIANRVFELAPGGQEVLAELKTLGLVGPNKEILSAPLAFMFAAFGNALYKEDEVLRGRGSEAAGNVFADGESFNLTSAMKIIKTDPDRARSLIAAAGKKPSDFGIQ